jgi:hypothetical protein
MTMIVPEDQDDDRDEDDADDADVMTVNLPHELE